MLKALLWKDYRVNRIVLLIGLILVLAPLLTGAGLNLYGRWRWGIWSEEWSSLLVKTAVIGASFSILIAAMLPGNAVAGERIDRSAEFLATLPPTRGLVVASKLMLVVAVLLITWCFHGVVIFVVAPLFGAVSQDVDAFRHDVLPVLLYTSVCTAGGAWMASCLLDSPTFATGIGMVSPVGVAGFLWTLQLVLERDRLLNEWYGSLSIVFATICMLAATVYFVRRAEP
jgi:ABC-type transport system involved in multi-copper enzyme maturation permease subunit